MKEWGSEPKVRKEGVMLKRKYIMKEGGCETKIINEGAGF